MIKNSYFYIIMLLICNYFPKGISFHKFLSTSNKFTSTVNKRQRVVLFSTSLHHIFVGNLPFSYSEKELNDLLKDKGIEDCLNVRITLDKKTGRSRGFGYLDFEVLDSAIKAEETLKGLEIEGRVLKIDKSDGVEGPNKGRRQSITSKEYSAFIGNLDYSLSEEDIVNLVKSELGEDIPITVRLYSVDGRSRGFGHLDFSNPDHVQLAIEKLNNYDVLGRNINVEVASGVNKNNLKKDPSDKYNTLDDSVQYSVFIGNLDYTVTAKMLLELVDNKVGPNLVENIRIALDKVTNKPKGFAHIDFIDNANARKAAIALNDVSLCDRLLRIDLATRSPPPNNNKPFINRNSKPYSNNFKDNNNNNSFDKKRSTNNKRFDSKDNNNKGSNNFKPNSKTGSFGYW